MVISTREYWASQVREHVDGEGHVFRYVPIQHAGSRGLVVHFSAFFGEWGDAPRHREIFQGHFHRLGMLGNVVDHDWLFLCDEYGPDRNGTYYTGEAGDLFVERAIRDLISEQMEALGHPAEDVLTMGSSMGATAALKFGLMLRVKGVVAISPHIDLDMCAERQARWRHVAAICPDGDPMAPHNYRYTRQVRGLIDGWTEAEPPPRLFVQACRDDDGVFAEQVEPLCAAWRTAGGSVTLDARRRGGHTSDHATRPLLLDVASRLFEGRSIDVSRYRRDRVFRGPSSASIARRDIRRLAGRFLRAVGLRPRPAGTGEHLGG
jgi:Accessory Sec system GspB-transporter